MEISLDGFSADNITCTQGRIRIVHNPIKYTFNNIYKEKK